MSARCASGAGPGDPLLTGFGYKSGRNLLNTTFYPYLRQAGGHPISEDGTSATLQQSGRRRDPRLHRRALSNGWADQAYLQPVEDGQDPFTLGSQALRTTCLSMACSKCAKNAPTSTMPSARFQHNREKWGFGGMRSWALAESSANKEAAGLLLEFLARPENAKRHGELSGTFPALTAAARAFSPRPGNRRVGRKPAVHLRRAEAQVWSRPDAPSSGDPGRHHREKDSQAALDDAAAAVNELFAQG